MSDVRPLYDIAAEIRHDWALKINYAAAPYLAAMAELDSINDPYYADDGHMIVRYFLSNATTWRGPVARRVKAELKEML